MASIVYVSSSTTDVITEIASTSEVIISNLQGPQGATGPQGPQGTPGGIASVVAPITNAGTETAAIIGINSSSANTANYVVQRDANKEFVAGAVTIDTTLTPTSAPGKLYWDGGGTVNLGLAGGNVSVALGENLVSYVTNAEATTLAVGEVVYVFGASGDRPSVKRASNASEVTSSKTLGIVAESIAAGQIGFVVTRGIIGKLTLGSYTEGAPVYLGSTAGTFTSTKPVAPANLVALGWVIRANNGNGQIYLNVQNGFELEELHNVLITSAANGNFLVYDSATSLWKNQAISATAPVTYNASTRTIAANSATTSATGVVQLSDSTSTTSSVLAATPTAVKAAYDLATTANATANAAIPATQKAAANGVATLDASGLVPTNQLPALAITNTFVVNSQAAMLALTAQPGDVAIRTDLSESYILTADPASTLANWQELLSPPDAVTSVDGRVGAVTLTDKYAQLATANTFTGSQTATSFVVTGSTLPANGVYLPAANTLGLATNSTLALQIGSTGNLALGGPVNAAAVIRVGKIITGGTTAFGLINRSVIQSDVTTTARIFESAPDTAANTFTVDTVTHYYTNGITSQGAGSSITTQTGFATGNLIQGATNNFGFYGGIPSGTGRWNVYILGTAANYFAGQTTVGSTSLTLGSGAVAQQFGVVAGAATTVGAVIRGAASQSASLTQWQNSAGTVLSSVDSAGNISAPTISATTRIQARTTDTNGIIVAGNDNVALIPFLAIGAVGQTASLQEWRNSGGTALVSITAAGNLNASQQVRIGTTSSLGQLSIVSLNAGNVGTAIQGAASQSADLLQLQTSTGAIVDSFDNAGNQRSQAQLIQYGAEGSLLQNIPTRVHPAETLLKQAVWWIDSAHSGSSGQAIKNLGWGGSALDTTAGSTTAADSNDPVYLGWDGVNYVYLPGVALNFMSIPDSAALDITGDIDVRAQIAVDDWTPAATNGLIGKTGGASDSWMLWLLGSGVLRLYWSPDGGTTLLNADSTVATGVADGTVKWVRATLDVNNGASGRDIKFFLSDDGITWTQLGSTVTQAGVTSIFSGTAPVSIGTAYSTHLVGKIYRAQILNGIDGVPVLDVDTSVIASGAATSFTALTGQTVTINRATSGRKTTVVTHPLWLFGTDDYMEVNNRWLERTTANYLYLPGVAGNYASAPDSAALDVTGDIDLRVKVALDDWTPAATQHLVSKFSTAALGRSYQLQLNTTGTLSFQYTTDGNTNILLTSTASVSVTDGSVKWVRGTRVASTGVVQFFTSDDGSTWTQLGTDVAGATGNMYASTTQLEIGSVSNGTTANSRGKFFRAQVLNGIGGTVAFDANFETGITTNLPTTFTESSANAATVTINYSGTGYRSAGVIASTYVFPGNPNTFKLSSYSMLDFGATDSFTAFVVARQFATTPTNSRLIQKRGGSVGWDLYNSAATQISGVLVDTTVTANFTNGANFTAGSLNPLMLLVDRSTTNSFVYVGTTASTAKSISTVGNLASFANLQIGASAGTQYADMEFISAAIFRRALTASEIATLNSYFQGRVA